MPPSTASINAALSSTKSIQTSAQSDLVNFLREEIRLLNLYLDLRAKQLTSDLISSCRSKIDPIEIQLDQLASSTPENGNNKLIVSLINQIDALSTTLGKTTIEWRSRSGILLLTIKQQIKLVRQDCAKEQDNGAKDTDRRNMNTFVRELLNKNLEKPSASKAKHHGEYLQRDQLPGAVISKHAQAWQDEDNEELERSINLSL